MGERAEFAWRTLDPWGSGEETRSREEREDRREEKKEEEKKRHEEESTKNTPLMRQGGQDAKKIGEQGGAY